LSADQFLLTSVEDAFLGVGVTFGPFAALATGLALIALVNAFNMADGRSGIIAGITAIWSTALALKGNDVAITAILALCAINSLVLGWHNLKSRLFFGDAGTYAIAAMFGCAAIVWHSHGVAGTQLTSLQVCSLFLVLVLDMIRLIILRIRAGRSPMAADHNHLHHRLDDHFGWPAGLVVYLALVSLPIVIAFQDFESAGALGVVLGIASYHAVIFRTRSALEGMPSETEVAPSLSEV
jgi:UDP-GlcNAc:undecaprenyl-phosphate GlcNAc-1-phosphate transferase